MKKFAILLVAILLSFALTACCCLEIPRNDSKFETSVIESEYVIVEPATDETESDQDTVEHSTSETESTNQVPYVSFPDTVEPEINNFDYSAFCGTYCDPEYKNYSVTINTIDNNTKSIEFTINYIGYNLSPIYDSNIIHATITDDNIVHFTWSDSWLNKGTGVMILDRNDTSSIQINVIVTEEADVNRATLSTFGKYKTLTR